MDTDVVRAGFAAFLVVFVAEFGDKSQLAALTFASRWRPGPVLAGFVLGTVTVMGVSVLAGTLVGSALPRRLTLVAGGLLFLAFCWWTARAADEDHDEHAGTRLRVAAGSVLLAVATAVFVAELGDKTMLTTVTLASQRDPVATWVGASAGMSAAGGAGVLAGRALGTRLPPRLTRRAAAALFGVFGVLMLVEAARSAA